MVSADFDLSTPYTNFVIRPGHCPGEQWRECIDNIFLLVYAIHELSALKPSTPPWPDGLMGWWAVMSWVRHTRFLSLGRDTARVTSEGSFITIIFLLVYAIHRFWFLNPLHHRGLWWWWSWQIDLSTSYTNFVIRPRLCPGDKRR